MGVKSDKKNVDQMPITHPFGSPYPRFKGVLATSNLQYIKVESDLAKDHWSGSLLFRVELSFVPSGPASSSSLL